MLTDHQADWEYDWASKEPGVPFADCTDLIRHIARLDDNSLVRQFAEGTFPYSHRLEDPKDESGVYATRILVRKTWHVTRQWHTRKGAENFTVTLQVASSKG